MTFRCKVCGRDAEIWYVYEDRFIEHINYEPEDGHEPIPPDVLTTEEIDEVFDLCSSSIKFVDEVDDNTYSFICDLTLGHVGSHQESGYYNNKKYVIWWTETDDENKEKEAGF